MVRLVVDSTFGLSETYCKENNIKVVSLKMIFDGEIYSEGFEDSYDAIYTKMQSCKTWPTTSQPSPQDYTDVIEGIYEEDKDAEIIVLTISSFLSGTINGATLATKNYPKAKIIAIDGKQATFGSRILCEEVVSLINAKKKFDEIVREIPKISKNISVYFIPENMESLKKSGRINSLSAKLVEMLKIKPIFLFKNNLITIEKKVIGLKRAMMEVANTIGNNIKKIYLGYIHDKINVAAFKDIVEKKLGKKVKVCAVDPVFGVHVGIGAIGIAYITE